MCVCVIVPCFVGWLVGMQRVKYRRPVDRCTPARNADTIKMDKALERLLCAEESRNNVSEATTHRGLDPRCSERGDRAIESWR